MMKLVNEKRGFTSRDDTLPERLFTPLPDGPSEGKHVDREKLEKMKREYYSMMGWDPDTGKIRSGKIDELGLEWAVEN
jgi:aldehyde:ferredoxin oxidoreductase